MKYIASKLYKMFVFCSLIWVPGSDVFALDTRSGECKITPSHVVVVALVKDGNDAFIIQGLIGTLGTAPSTWTATILSAGISSVRNSSPHLFSNALGDIVVLWQYVDELGIGHVAAAVLPNGTTTWQIADISHDTGMAAYEDHFAHIDESRNALAIWTSYNVTTDENEIFSATTLIGTSTFWNDPIIISQ